MQCLLCQGTQSKTCFTQYCGKLLPFLLDSCHKLFFFDINIDSSCPSFHSLPILKWNLVKRPNGVLDAWCSRQLMNQQERREESFGVLAPSGTSRSKGGTVYSWSWFQAKSRESGSWGWKQSNGTLEAFSPDCRSRLECMERVCKEYARECVSSSPCGCACVPSRSPFTLHRIMRRRRPCRHHTNVGPSQATVYDSAASF